jgi:hypothetical protein
MWLKFEQSISRIQIIIVCVPAEQNWLVYHGVFSDGKSVASSNLWSKRQHDIEVFHVKFNFRSGNCNNIPAEYLVHFHLTVV